MNTLIRSRLVLSLLLSCLGLAVAGHSAHAAEPPPIVFIVFDELPTVSLQGADGGIDAGLYPNFAALAATSTWARGASTVATRQLEAMPALLTGTMPRPDRTLSIRSEFADNLFTWLEDEYALNVREQQTLLGPTRLDAKGQARWLTEVRNDRYEMIDQSLLFDGFLATIERLAAAEPAAGETRQPALDFMHLLLPIAPWRYSGEGRTYAPHRLAGNVGGVWTGDEGSIEDGWRRHILEARYADVMLGRLVDTLRRAGRFDESLIIVTSSFGAGFWPNESRRTPSATTHPEDVMLVPLFVKAPGQKKGVVSDAVVQSVDVLPTIVGVLGREAPWPMAGCSILDASCPRASERSAMRLDGSGEGRSIDVYPADLHERRATLERKLALFPDTAHLDRTWPAGRFEDWLDEPVDEKALVAAPATPGTWSFDRSARAWTRAETGGPRVAALVDLGKKRGAPDDAPPPLIAIALNGRLQAITRPVVDRRGRFAVLAMLPDARLEPSDNVLELYVVREDASGAKLEPLVRKAPAAKKAKKKAPTAP